MFDLQCVFAMSAAIPKAKCCISKATASLLFGQGIQNPRAPLQTASRAGLGQPLPMRSSRSWPGTRTRVLSPLSLRPKTATARGNGGQRPVYAPLHSWVRTFQSSPVALHLISPCVGRWRTDDHRAAPFQDNVHPLWVSNCGPEAAPMYGALMFHGVHTVLALLPPPPPVNFEMFHALKPFWLSWWART